MKQLVLSGFEKVSLEHGGETRVGQRKIARPIATKRAMHLVMRATVARGAMSLLRRENARIVNEELERASRIGLVKIYRRANVGNHIHLLVRAKTREGFRTFLRMVTGRIAQRVTGAKKGKPFGKRFWDLTAFSRIVEWGNAFKTACGYLLKNEMEAFGVRLPCPPRSLKQKAKTSRPKDKGQRKTLSTSSEPFCHLVWLL